MRNNKLPPSGKYGLRREPITPNMPHRNSAVLGFLLLVVADVLTGCGDLQSTHTQPQSAAVTATTAKTPQLTPEAQKLKTFAEFRDNEPVPANLAVTAADLTARMNGAGSCTVTIINDLAVSASHCKPTETEGQRIESWQGGFAYRGSVINAATAPGVDLLVGKVKWVKEAIRSWKITLAENKPLPGKQFVIASLPGSSTQPIVSNLTYLGEATIKDSPGIKWLFAVDPEVTHEIAASVCDPGASGSLILNNHNEAAILTNVDQLWKKSPANRESDLTSLSSQYGVDLHNVSGLCYATPLLASTFKAYQDVLG